MLITFLVDLSDNFSVARAALDSKEAMIAVTLSSLSSPVCYQLTEYPSDQKISMSS